MELGKVFSWLDTHPGEPDNHVLELAKVIGYRYPDYSAKEDAGELMMDAILGIAQSPELVELVQNHKEGTPMPPAELLAAISANPAGAMPMLKFLMKTGHLSVPTKTEPPPRPVSNFKKRTGRK